MIKLAAVYRDMGEYETAKQYFQKVKDIHRNVLPDNHREKADFYVEYAKLKLKIDEPGQAQQHFQKAYNIYRDNFVDDSIKTKKVQTYLENIAHA